MVIWIKLGLALLVFILSVLKDWPWKYLKVPQQWAKWVRYLVPVGLALVLFSQSIVGIFEDKPLTQEEHELSQQVQTDAIIAVIEQLKPAVDTLHVFVEDYPSITHSELYRSTMKSIEDAFLNRDYRTAITLATFLVKTLPESPPLSTTHHIMSLSYAELNMYDSAVVAGASAVTSDSGVAMFWSNLASFQLRNGKVREILQNLDYAIALDSTLLSAWLNKAIALSNSVLHSDALIAADRAISLDSTSGAAWYYKARALSGLDRDLEAIASYDMALTRVDSSSIAWLWTLRAYPFAKMHDWRNAMISVDSALEHDTTLADAWGTLGLFAVLHWGDTALARSGAEAAIRFDSTNRIAQYINFIIEKHFTD